jgi:hypothetical protein
MTDNPYQSPDASTLTPRKQSRETSRADLAKGAFTVTLFSIVGGLLGSVQAMNAVDELGWLLIVVSATFVGVFHVLSVLTFSSCGVDLDKRFWIWNTPELIAIVLILTSPLTVCKIAAWIEPAIA